MTGLIQRSEPLEVDASPYVLQSPDEAPAVEAEFPEMRESNGYMFTENEDGSVLIQPVE